MECAYSSHMSLCAFRTYKCEWVTKHLCDQTKASRQAAQAGQWLNHVIVFTYKWLSQCIFTWHDIVYIFTWHDIVYIFTWHDIVLLYLYMTWHCIYLYMTWHCIYIYIHVHVHVWPFLTITHPVSVLCYAIVLCSHCAILCLNCSCLEVSIIDHTMKTNLKWRVIIVYEGLWNEIHCHVYIYFR